MSNPVRVSVKAKLKFTVKHEDEVELHLGKDPIFSDERAEATIENVMQAHGWQKEEKEGKTVYVKTDENTEKTWDVKENKLTIKAQKEEIRCLDTRKVDSMLVTQQGQDWWQDFNTTMKEINSECEKIM